MNNDDTFRSRIKQRKAEKVVVQTKSHIKIVIDKFMPSSDSHIRQLLVKGLEDVSKRDHYYDEQQKIDIKEFGDYQPSKIDNRNAIHWVDRLIKDRMDAKRIGLLIYWNLDGVKYTFDPFTGVLSDG